MFETPALGNSLDMVNVNRLPGPMIDAYEWQYEGLCAGVDSSVFFSPEAERGAKRERREEAAKSLCRRCPVIQRCREHALAVREPYGVWGGMTEGERAALARTAKIAS